MEIRDSVEISSAILSTHLTTKIKIENLASVLCHITASAGLPDILNCSLDKYESKSISFSSMHWKDFSNRV